MQKRNISTLVVLLCIACLFCTFNSVTADDGNYTLVYYTIIGPSLSTLNDTYSNVDSIGQALSANLANITGYQASFSTIDLPSSPFNETLYSLFDQGDIDSSDLATAIPAEYASNVVSYGVVGDVPTTCYASGNYVFDDEADCLLGAAYDLTACTTDDDCLVSGAVCSAWAPLSDNVCIDGPSITLVQYNITVPDSGNQTLNFIELLTANGTIAAVEASMGCFSSILDGNSVYVVSTESSTQASFYFYNVSLAGSCADNVAVLQQELTETVPGATVVKTVISEDYPAAQCFIAPQIDGHIVNCGVTSINCDVLCGGLMPCDLTATTDACPNDLVCGTFTPYDNTAAQQLPVCQDVIDYNLFSYTIEFDNADNLTIALTRAQTAATVLVAYEGTGIGCWHQDSAVRSYFGTSSSSIPSSITLYVTRVVNSTECLAEPPLAALIAAALAEEAAASSSEFALLDDSSAVDWITGVSVVSVSDSIDSSCIAEVDGTRVVVFNEACSTPSSAGAFQTCSSDSDCDTGYDCGTFTSTTSLCVEAQPTVTSLVKYTLTIVNQGTDAANQALLEDAIEILAEYEIANLCWSTVSTRQYNIPRTNPATQVDVYVTGASTDGVCAPVPTAVSDQWGGVATYSVLTSNFDTASCVNSASNTFNCTESECSDLVKCNSGAFSACTVNSDCQSGLKCEFWLSANGRTLGCVSAANVLAYFFAVCLSLIAALCVF